jgi:phenylalanyl-tRNA synthetase beta chain
MKISSQWLREFADLPATSRELAEALTNAGAAVEGIAGEGEDLIFEMEITTNRPDEMNHYGVAREAAAIYGVPLKRLGGTPFPGVGKAASSKFVIEIEDAEGCARYTARIIRDAKVTQSPEPIAQRLMSVEQRPINNAADASNYTLWEMGHPTHAFDMDLLEGGKIIVRRARAGETLKTLDGVDRKLTTEDLIIADARKPVALAGVMGGFDTMITERTKNVLIESAWFDPVTVRKMAKRHAMHTDASHRFERGADYGATSLACARVAHRIVESGGGELDAVEMDAVARQIAPVHITLRMAEVERILGKALAPAGIVRILKALGFGVEEAGADFAVQVPSWRLDVEREIDLIEELARIHGFDQFPNTLPTYSGAVEEMPGAAGHSKLRSLLLGLGYNEAVSLSFISQADATRFAPSLTAVPLANPLSEEASVMRTSLAPGMLDMLAYNLNRSQTQVRLFEMGAIHAAAGEGCSETRRACLGATWDGLRRDLPLGGILNTSKDDKAVAMEVFRSFKGDVESVLAAFEHESLAYVAMGDAGPYYHPGRSARVLMDGQVVALFGQVHPEVAAARKLRQDVMVAEIFVDRLYEKGLRQIRYTPIPRYPAVERDFSFVMPDAVQFEAMERAVLGLGIAELRSFAPAEIFRGGAVPAGKYSILLRATFQSPERTLREEEVAQWSAQVMRVLEGMGGSLRT